MSRKRVYLSVEQRQLIINAVLEYKAQRSLEALKKDKVFIAATPAVQKAATEGCEITTQQCDEIYNLIKLDEYEY